MRWEKSDSSVCSDQSLRWEDRELVIIRQRIVRTKGMSCVDRPFQPQGTVYEQVRAKEGRVSQNPDLGSQGSPA